MPATSAKAAGEFLPSLTPFDSAFIRTVLDHRGVGARPSLADFLSAFNMLRRYYQQCLDNPPESDTWAPRLGEERLAEMEAYQQQNPPPGRTERKPLRRSITSELTGEVFRFEELPAPWQTEPNRKPADVSPWVRALADLALVLFNSNEFVYVY